MKVNSDIKPNKRKYIQEKMIQTVSLDPCEEKFFELGPNFAMMEDLDIDRIKRYFLISLTKIRWGRMGKEESEVVRW